MRYFYFLDMFSTPKKSTQKSYSKDNSKLIQNAVHGSGKTQDSHILANKCFFNPPVRLL